jgi:hypothetical protein
MWRNRDHTSERSHLTLAWSIVAIFLIVDLIWLPFSRVTFASANGPRIAYAVLILAVLACVPGIVRYRLRGDASRAARALLAMAGSLSLLTRAAAFTVAMGIVGVMFSYLATGLAWPMRDAELAAIDRALGFDWRAFLNFTNSYPVVSWTLRTAYHTAAAQIVLIYLLLSFTRRACRLYEFLANLAVSSLLTGLLMALVPAEGAYAHYRPAPGEFNHYSADAGMWHHALLTELRTQAAPVLDFATAQGLVTFPSFHTALAIITWFAVRDVRYLSPLVAALNITVIVATLPEGGHHLVDPLVGAAIAAAAIMFVSSWPLARRSANVGAPWVSVSWDREPGPTR